MAYTKKKCKAAGQDSRFACAARLIIFHLLLALPAVVQAQFHTTNDNGKMIITKYTGSGGAVVIPEIIDGFPVITIGDLAFCESHLLTDIKIPDSITTIEWHAFMSCYFLTNVTIGSGVTNIGDDAGWLAFHDCSKLTMITVDARNPVFSSVDGVLLNKSEKQISLIKCPESKAGSYTVPDNVTKIETHSFSGSTYLTGVTIGGSVRSIEDNAFENCVGLASVKMGNNVKSIGSSAFLSCTSLTTITIPNSVTNIGDAAFYSCSSLTNVTIGKGVTSIGISAFSSCGSSIVITVDPLNPIYGSENGVVFNKHQRTLPVPTVLIDGLTNNASINAMCVDVLGTFSAENLKQIIVETPQANMGMPAVLNGNKFEARNIFLQPGTNTISAIAEDMNGNTGTNTIMVMGPTDTNSAQTFPVQIQISTSGGFVPLPVTFTVQTHVPGKIQKVIYDFDGDNIPDQTNSDLQPVTHIYKTAREYYPVVTIQTTVGRFSSLSGMMAMYAAAFGNSDAIADINVQLPPVVLSTIKIADPVDVKWTSTSNLYVLSESTATITEFDGNGKVLRSIKGIGTKPSGFDVDNNGNIYVAVSGDNQIKKFKPTTDSFEIDTTFGASGLIGNKDGNASSNQFNSPFDVKLSRDGQTITVSDSGNRRIRQFDINGTPRPEEGGTGYLNTPKGLAHDELGIYLFTVDSGNSRIVLMSGSMPLGTSGTNGLALGQFNGALHLSANKRALYVADTGNNRVQVFSHVQGGEMHSPVPFNPRFALSGELGLNHPKSVAAVEDFLEEEFYIADTGNNRVILVKLPSDSPEAVWKHMIARLKAGDIQGAMSDFSIASKDKYQRAYQTLSKDELLSTIKDMENIKPATIESDRAQYYFESLVEGKTITFPVEFDKEFGQWKIMEY
jgi:hypothetical protein